MKTINYDNLREEMLKKYGNPEHFVSSINESGYALFEVKVFGKFVCKVVMSTAERNSFTRSKYFLKGVTVGGLGYVNPLKYFIFNDTDSIFAQPDTFTFKAAEKWISLFKRTMQKHQGYYLTSGRESIPVNEVEFLIIPEHEREAEDDSWAFLSL